MTSPMSKQQHFWPVAKFFYNMSTTCCVLHLVLASYLVLQNATCTTKDQSTNLCNFTWIIHKIFKVLTHLSTPHLFLIDFTSLLMLIWLQPSSLTLLKNFFFVMQKQPFCFSSFGGLAFTGKSNLDCEDYTMDLFWIHFQGQYDQKAHKCKLYPATGLVIIGFIVLITIVALHDQFCSSCTNWHSHNRVPSDTLPQATMTSTIDNFVVISFQEVSWLNVSLSSIQPCNWLAHYHQFWQTLQDQPN